MKMQEKLMDFTIFFVKKSKIILFFMGFYFFSVAKQLRIVYN